VSGRIEVVLFNHEQTAATNAALNIRRNLTEVVRLPEW
jgi:hypothetical protein